MTAPALNNCVQIDGGIFARPAHFAAPGGGRRMSGKFRQVLMFVLMTIGRPGRAGRFSRIEHSAAVASAPVPCSGK